ncbi:MAG: hypothetical protein K2O69_00010 [Odoribacter sp.]|nr:hypothetical protein [Odoribacter sp.]
MKNFPLTFASETRLDTQTRQNYERFANREITGYGKLTLNTAGTFLH